MKKKQVAYKKMKREPLQFINRLYVGRKLNRKEGFRKLLKVFEGKRAKEENNKNEQKQN